MCAPLDLGHSASGLLRPHRYKHPALGEPFDRIWHDLWHCDLKPIVTRAFAEEALHVSDIALVMTRKGHKDWPHFSFSDTPMRDAGGAVQGFFCPCLEITEQVLEERRTRTRAELTERLRTSRDPTELVAPRQSSSRRDRCDLIQIAALIPFRLPHYTESRLCAESVARGCVKMRAARWDTIG